MYRKNAWEKYSEKVVKEVYEFGNEYKEFISKCKTEREVTNFSIELLKEKGFKEFNEFETLKPGDKVYFVNKGKNVCVNVRRRKTENISRDTVKSRPNIFQNQNKIHPIPIKFHFMNRQEDRFHSLEKVFSCLKKMHRKLLPMKTL